MNFPVCIEVAAQLQADATGKREAPRWRILRSVSQVHTQIVNLLDLRTTRRKSPGGISRNHPSTRTGMIKRLAHVYTKHAGDREHFQLPEDYDRFHAWVSEHQDSAPDPYAFSKGYEIVKWYLSNMSFANRQGMYQVIVWQDEGESPVTVEHHRVKAIA